MRASSETSNGETVLASATGALYYPKARREQLGGKPRGTPPRANPPDAAALAGAPAGLAGAPAGGARGAHGQRDSEAIKCYHCGKPGHMKTACAEWRKTADGVKWLASPKGVEAEVARKRAGNIATARGALRAL